MARRLILLRHGQTPWNATATAQGHADIPLDHTGHRQAKAAAAVLAGSRATRLWTSDLVRAAQTASYVASACGLQAVADPRLREFDVGERTGLTMQQFERRYPAEYAAWRNGKDEPRVPGAESTSEVRARVLPALIECWNALGPDGTGIVVLHGGCLKVGLFGVLRWDWERASSMRGLANCGWAILQAGTEDPHARLVAYNRVAEPGVDFVVDGPVG